MNQSQADIDRRNKIIPIIQQIYSSNEFLVVAIDRTDPSKPRCIFDAVPNAPTAVGMAQEFIGQVYAQAILQNMNRQKLPDTTI